GRVRDVPAQARPAALSRCREEPGRPGVDAGGGAPHPCPSLALLTWEPYMHNPKLKHRLHWVNVPTLFVRGASDGIVSAEYLERYAALIPQARTETIAEAGHLPQVEQPTATAAKVLRFLQVAQAGETAGARS